MAADYILLYSTRHKIFSLTYVDCSYIVHLKKKIEIKKVTVLDLAK